MREIVLDTETTGLDPSSGHRVVEIGCIELANRIPTGATYHIYLNPERDMPREAEAVHGLSLEFLADKPRFAEVADDLIAFLGDAVLVIHNAGFDLAFLNAEFDARGPSGDRARARGGYADACAPRAIPAGRTGSTTCAFATASIIHAAPSTAR